MIENIALCMLNVFWFFYCMSLSNKFFEKRKIILSFVWFIPAALNLVAVGKGVADIIIAIQSQGA